jgi:von Willebrand factor type A domain
MLGVVDGHEARRAGLGRVARGLARLLFLAAVTASVARGQSQGCLRRTVVASVTGPGGAAVTGLTPGDFRASFLGRPVRILSVARAAGPRHIVVLLDASGSMLADMDQPWKWPLAMAALRELYDRTPAGAQIALAIFAEKVEKEADFQQSPGGNAGEILRLSELPRLRKGLGGLGRETALWDSIEQSLGMFPALGRGDVLYVITDGGNDAGHSDPTQAARTMLTRRGVRLFAFLDYAPSPPRLGVGSSIGPEELADLAQDTGGGAISNGSPDWRSLLQPAKKAGRSPWLRLALDGMYGQMTSFYSVEIELPRLSNKPREWKLELPGLEKQVLLSYSREILPCGWPAPRAK